MSEQLAINGGPKVKTTPFGTGKRFGDAELVQLKEALDQETLFYWSGSKVKAFTAKFAEMYGMKYCVATSSGTAAIHVGLGTVGVTAGDEVIVGPITDAGSIIGILYQNALPVFADLDPNTYNMDPKSIEEKITDKTKAILVVHLAGNPSDMDAIMAVAKKHNIAVVEDCAQSYNAMYKGKPAGTFGDVGCFSTNDFKHISTGDGGLVVTNNEEMYHKALRFADKNYSRNPDEPAAVRSIPYLAPNYRMTELQGAVGLAQLEKLGWITGRRNRHGDRITEGISGIKGILPHKVLPGCECSYWFYMMTVDEQKLGCTRAEFSAALGAEGIPNQVGYIPFCVYEYDLLKNKNVYDGTKSPFDAPEFAGREYEYKKGLCPTAEKILDTAIKFAVNEFYTDQDIEDIIAGIKKVAGYYAK